MKIYFLRHGATKLNEEGRLNGQIDEPLSSLGFEQAATAAENVPKNVKTIRASSMLRAVQTGRVISTALGIPLLSHDSLREINMGSFAGKSWGGMDTGEDFKRIHRSMQFDYRKVGGESAQEFRKRIIRFANEVDGQYQDFELLLVAHGGVQRLFDLLQGQENLAEIDNAVLLEFDLSKIIKNANRSITPTR